LIHFYKRSDSSWTVRCNCAMPPTNLFRFFLHVLPSFLFFQTGVGLECVQCSSLTSPQCSSDSPGPATQCSPEDTTCLTLKHYTQNLQDDSDANVNDDAGKRVKLERTCSEVWGDEPCRDIIEQGRALVECRSYCNISGCNTGLTHFTYGTAPDSFLPSLALLIFTQIIFLLIFTSSER